MVQKANDSNPSSWNLKNKNRGKVRSKDKDKEDDLSPNSAPIEKRAKREGKPSEVEIKPAAATAVGTATATAASRSNHQIDEISASVSGFQLQAKTLQGSTKKRRIRSSERDGVLQKRRFWGEHGNGCHHFCSENSIP